MSELTFDPAKHIYRVNGLRVPSVTGLLKPMQDWSHIPTAVLERKARLGTVVHKICELYALGDLDEKSVHPKAKPYFEAFKRFMDEKQPVIHGTEKRLYNDELGYAGTMDLDLQMMGRRFVIDLKATIVHYPITAIQLAGYKRLMRVDSGLEPVTRAALKLGKDGQYNIKVYDSEDDWPAFKALLSAHNWRINHDPAYNKQFYGDFK